jgi:integrase
MIAPFLDEFIETVSRNFTHSSWKSGPHPKSESWEAVRVRRFDDSIIDDTVARFIEGAQRVRGHIRERSPGRWAIVLEGRDPRTGERKRRWHSFEGTKREAQLECARLIAATQSGTLVEPSRLTVAVFLARWLDYIMPQVAPRTGERYAEIVRTYLVPALGGILLTKLQTLAISGAYAAALKKGRQKGAGGLSARTVNHMHRILKQALGQAVHWQLLSRNPADHADPPRVERNPMKVWDIGTMAEALERARPLRIFLPALLAGLCGLRRGEIAALRWRNVDLDRGQLAVVESAEQTRASVRLKSPKSGRGRMVVLPANAIRELRIWRGQQAQQLLKLGIRISDDTFVCAREDGAMIQPQSITHAWNKFVVAAKLPRIRFHDMRHSHATHLLASGVHPKIASERLGHATVGLTLDTYSHVIPGMQEDAAARIDAAFSRVR